MVLFKLHEKRYEILRATSDLRTTGVRMKFQYGNGDSPLDGYVIRRGIGVGGFGEVYFAESDSGKEVALKRIQKNLDVEMRGVRHCLNLRHPNLVSVYDIRYDADQQGWIVMEFIEGESLRDQLDRNTDPPVHAYENGDPNRVVPVFAQMVAGVTYLHDQGIVHRDLKPANIFIERGLAKIGDYGLSKYISASRRAGQTESVGTFHYMAPEIGKGEYGKEIDIYSLGIILYEMLTGNVPFDGESTQEILLKHLTDDPDLSALPQGIATVVSKCLAKNPTLRYRDGRELLDDLGYTLMPGGFVSQRSQMDFHHPHEHAAAYKAASENDRSSPTPRPAQSAQKANRQGGSDNPAFRTNTQNQLSPTERLNAFFTLGIDGHRMMMEREPIYLMLRSTISGMKAGIGTSKKFNGKQSKKNADSQVLVAIIAIAAILWFSALGIIAAWGLLAYAVYYSLWFFGHVTSQDIQNVRAGAFNAAALQETVRYENPKGSNSESKMVSWDQAKGDTIPVAANHRSTPRPPKGKTELRRWRDVQRMELAHRNPWIVGHEWIRALSFGGLVSAVLAAVGGFLAINAGFLSSMRPELGTAPPWAAVAWMGIMSVLSTWTILSLARRWESRTEDSIAFRFAMFIAGLILGAVSFQLSEYLLVPWEAISNPNSGIRIRVLDKNILENTYNRTWKGFYDPQGIPTLAGHMAYFGLLFWIVRWWRQSDILRKKKFSYWIICWSMIAAGLVQLLFYFPSPWTYWFAGITSLAVQVASPWIDPNDPTYHRRMQDA
jgi:serine/threonine protein kinase